MNDLPSTTSNTGSTSSPGTTGSDQQGVDEIVKALQATQAPGGSGEGKEKEAPVAAEPTTVEQSVEALEFEETKEEMPEEVSGWVERVSRGEDVNLAKPVVHQGEVLIEPARKGMPRLVLPLTEEGMRQGFHHKVIDSVRWLAEWCWRLVKKLPGKVLYRTSS